MKLQRIWAALIGTASTVIGVLKFFSIVKIPALDAVVHITTGIIFLGGSFLLKGKFVRQSNISMGIVYFIFGIYGLNIPHILAGAISLLIGIFAKT